MDKGVEIAFQLSNGTEDRELVMAMSNIVGNEFKAEMGVDWRIFHVSLGENKYFRVLYAGPHLSKLHPLNEKRIRERFDELSHKSYKEVMEECNRAKKTGNFTSQPIQEKKEEYNLWQDKLWDYICSPNQKKRVMLEIKFME
ncbi:MAG: hypothetical protein B2I17_07340 [Thermoplasmatales archaeon B_DKE]|nr:MAG: hypothetical protein B2I17_07340 [Thermoplasmatales archaeon B_DKE]